MADPEVSDSHLYALASKLISDAEAALPGVGCTVLVHHARQASHMIVVGSTLQDAEMRALLATAVVSSAEGEMHQYPGLSVADIAERDAQALQPPARVTPITSARRHGRTTRCKDRRP